MHIQGCKAWPIKGKAKRKASVTFLKLFSSFVAESRLQTKELIQADTFGQMRVKMELFGPVRVKKAEHG